MKSANFGWACVLYLAGLAVVYKGRYERRLTKPGAQPNQPNQPNQPQPQPVIQVIPVIPVTQRQVIKAQGGLRSRPIIRGRRSQQVKVQRTKPVWLGPQSADLNAPFAVPRKPGEIKKKEEE